MSTPVLPGNRRILTVDDNPAIQSDFRKTLAAPERAGAAALASLEADLFETETASQGEQFDLDSAMSGEAGIEMVAAARACGRPYALAFVDVRMPPGCDGIEAAVRMWQADPDLNVVICTAYADYSWSQMVQRLGGTERWVVLRKPFDAIEVRQLALALTRRWSNARDQNVYARSLENEVQQRNRALELANEALTREMANLRESEKKISELALQDSLTGLPNRRFIETHLSYQIAQATRAKQSLALISIDLDRFKWVNDTLGHAAGDAVLKTAADRLRTSLRSGDCVARGPLDTISDPSPPDEGTVARLGGDEFVVLLYPVAGIEAVRQVATRLVTALAQPMVIEGRELAIGASLGIAFQPTDGTDADTLLRKADTALYHAKEQGRGKFHFFADASGPAVDNRLWLDNEMRKAVARNQLEVHYQPQMDSSRGVPSGAEALVRWKHPERGPISPGEFIPLADETGFIVELGAWVLRAVCRQAAAWRAEGHDFGRIAVNVSPRQLKSHAFVDTVLEALAESGLPGSCLELEITEGALAAERGETDRILRSLKETGLHIALDDFGTGYSSLAHLTGWPIDVLKIDQSFVRRVAEDRRSRGVVKAVIALAQSFDVAVVGEGVETEAQRDALRAEGCHRMQGYLFCRPVAPAAFAAWMTGAKAQALKAVG